MNTLWCYKGYLVRSSEHLCLSLTALELLLVFFHFKSESTYLIYWYKCLFSPLFTLRLVLFLTYFWCSFVCIYSSMNTKAEESSVFAQGWSVLISSPDTWDWTRMLSLVVMQRRTLCGQCQNKGAFLQISIFYARHRCIVSSYIISIYRSISMNRYTPNKYLRINNEPRLNNSICNVAFSIQELSKYKSPTLLFGDWFISNQFQCEMKLTLNRPGSGSHEGNWIKISLPVWWEFIPDINIMSHFVTGFLFLTDASEWFCISTHSCTTPAVHCAQLIQNFPKLQAIYLHKDRP